MAQVPPSNSFPEPPASGENQSGGPFGANSPTPAKDPTRPRLFNGATRHGLLGDLTLRHPWDIPLFAVAAIIVILLNLAWLAAVVAFIILIATGNFDPFSSVEPAEVADPYGVASMLIQLFVLVGALPWAIWIARALLYAHMRANGVRMTPTQFPEGYRMLAEASAQFGLRRVPDAYVISGSGTINAFAAGHGFRRFVVIYSDLFEVGGSVRDPEALRFVIAHEVGHHAAGHAGYLRILLSNLVLQIPILGTALSRAQEYSADNYGYAHTADGSAGAMALLAGGKYLNAHVNVQEIADRAATERGLWVHLVHWTSTHPVLTWRTHALRDRSRPGRMWLRPKNRIFEPDLPAGSAWSAHYPTPEQALALLDRAHAEGRVPNEEQFGRFPFGHNYPAPERMRELQVRPPSPYAQEGTVNRAPSRRA